MKLNDFQSLSHTTGKWQNHNSNKDLSYSTKNHHVLSFGLSWELQWPSEPQTEVLDLVACWYSFLMSNAQICNDYLSLLHPFLCCDILPELSEAPYDFLSSVATRSWSMPSLPQVGDNIKPQRLHLDRYILYEWAGRTELREWVAAKGFQDYQGSGERSKI